MKATALLKKDHAEVKKLFRQFGSTTTRAVKRRRELLEKIGKELDVHARIEEEIFYPRLAELGSARSLVEEGRREHDKVKTLLAEIADLEPDSEEVEARVGQLRDAVLHHVTEEEREMFSEAEALGGDELQSLGERLEARKGELTGKRSRRTPARGSSRQRKAA